MNGGKYQYWSAFVEHNSDPQYNISLYVIGLRPLGGARPPPVHRHDLPKEFTVNLPTFDLIQRPAHPRRCFQCSWLVKPDVLHCFGIAIDITRHQSLSVKNGAVQITNEAN